LGVKRGEFKKSVLFPREMLNPSPIVQYFVILHIVGLLGEWG